MKMKRKALAFLLTLCMLFVLIPAQPAAADESYGTLRALNEEKTFYAMDYRYDYQMSDLLTHNIHDSNDLVKWVVSHLISSDKDLSYSINMGDGGACSAFVAQDNNDNILYARNYDYLQAHYFLIRISRNRFTMPLIQITNSGLLKLKSLHSANVLHLWISRKAAKHLWRNAKPILKANRFLNRIRN